MRVADNQSASERKSAARRLTRAQRLRSSILPCLRTTFVSGTLVLVILAAIPALAVTATLLTFRTGELPGSMLILQKTVAGEDVDRRWVPLSGISNNLVRAVIASEDGQFCRHDGIDRKELQALIEQADDWADEPTRGGSTITMQLAKNLFLWNSRSIVRKAIEIPIALAIERIWTKDRILEVYLNVAEWGPGIFGAEAAAQTYFRKSASRLLEREAALLAVALPNPAVRIPNQPTQRMQRVAQIVEARARRLGTRANCVRGSG